MKRIITDKTGGLVNIRPPRITYVITEHDRTTEQVIAALILEEASRTFDLPSIKEALENHKVTFEHNDKLVFLARNVTGGSHVLIEVVYSNENNSKEREEFVVTGVKVKGSILPKGIIVVYGYI